MGKKATVVKFSEVQLQALIKLFKSIRLETGEPNSKVFLAFKSTGEDVTTLLVKQGGVVFKMTFRGDLEILLEYVVKSLDANGLAYELVDAQKFKQAVTLMNDVRSEFIANELNLVDLKKIINMLYGVGCFKGLIRPKGDQVVFCGAMKSRHVYRSSYPIGFQKDGYFHGRSASGWFDLLDMLSLIEYLGHLDYADLTLKCLNVKGHLYVVVEHGAFSGIIIATH